MRAFASSLIGFALLTGPAAVLADDPPAANVAPMPAQAVEPAPAAQPVADDATSRPERVLPAPDAGPRSDTSNFEAPRPTAPGPPPVPAPTVPGPLVIPPPTIPPLVGPPPSEMVMIRHPTAIEILFGIWRDRRVPIRVTRVEVPADLAAQINGGAVPTPRCAPAAPPVQPRPRRKLFSRLFSQ